MNKRYVVCDGWHESKSLGCDFKVENGMITHATGIAHDLPKYAYNSKAITGYIINRFQNMSNWENAIINYITEYNKSLVLASAYGIPIEPIYSYFVQL